jgi:hypothetical protein
MAANATGGKGGESAYNNQVVTLQENAESGVQPFVEVTYTSATQGGGQTQTIKTNISGSQTKSLTVSSDTVGVQQVKCLVKHPTAALNYFQGQLPSFNLTSGIVDGGLMTDPANFEAISAVNLTQSNLTIEIVRDDDVNRFRREEQNLFLGPLNLQATTSDFDMTRAINVFAPDENITVRVDMAGSAGQSFNGNSGGEGGRCTFTTTLQKGVEYTFKLGATVEPTSSIGRGGAGAYFYEKGRLLVACGGGGASGWYGGSGGDGGGAGVAGQSGSGANRGAGGTKYNDGELPAAGVLPSGATGGKIESCTTGGYWNTQGFSPCSDIGQRQFVLANGQVNTSTSTIERGYKAADVNSDYGFRHNGGNSQVIGANGLFVGGGGAGAGGGNAASGADSGGGGASGYSNGTVTITSAEQGGNNSSLAFAQIRLLT